MLKKFISALIFLGMPQFALASDIVNNDLAKTTVFINSAESSDGAQLNHYVVATVKFDGVILTEKWAYTWNESDEPTLVSKLYIGLNPTVAERFRNTVAQLAGAVVETTYATEVCTMLPAPSPDLALRVSKSFDQATETFSNELVSIDSNAGCWATSHTRLTDDRLRVRAENLQAEIEVLVLQYID